MAKGDQTRISDATVKKDFKKYLEGIGLHDVEIDSDGVDVVALTSDNQKLYFELKACGKTEKNLRKNGYFGAITMVEWQCAFTHPNEFYIVFVWQNPINDKSPYRFRPFKFNDLFQYSRFEPFATYLNIPIGDKSLNDFLTFNSKDQNATFEDFHQKKEEHFPDKTEDENYKKRNMTGKNNFDEERRRNMGEDIIWTYCEFYYRQKIDTYIAEYKGQHPDLNPIFYIVPSDEVEKLLKTGLQQGDTIMIVICDSAKSLGKIVGLCPSLENCNTCAIIKLNRENLDLKTETINQKHIARIINDTTIAKNDILERYFRISNENSN